MIEVVLAIAFIFLVASAMLFIFNKLGHPTIPAYIITGILISPFVQETNILSLAEIGIAFLVFIFSSQLKLKETEKIMENSAILTFSQVAIVGLIVYGYAYVLGLGELNAIYLAVAASLSSSLVGTELIKGETLKIAYKRLCRFINQTQDLIAIVIFLVLASITLTVSGISTNIEIGGRILLLGVLGKILMPYLFNSVKRSPESLMLIGLSTLLIFTTVSQYFHLSIVIGAFAAGMTLSTEPYNKELLEMFEPLKDFFLALFFIAIGALVVLPNLPTLLTALGLIFVILIVKPLFTVLLMEAQGYSKGTSLTTALNLDHTSEFALILAIHAHATGQIEPFVFQAIILSAVITMITSSYTSRHVWQIYDKIKTNPLINLPGTQFVESKIPEEISEHFIIAGYDVQGTEIAKFLKEQGKEVIVIDSDPEQIQEAKENNMNYIYGDIMIDETWAEANYKEAEMIISTVPVEEITEKIIDLDTEASRIIREENPRKAKKYLDKVLYVMVPTYLSSNKLIEHLEGCLESEEYKEKLRKINKEKISQNDEK